MALYEFNVARPDHNGRSTPLKTYSDPFPSSTFVEGRKGSEYVLTFKNNSSHRVLVVASVDGLSVMDGKPASVKSTGYIVDAWSTIEIPGWRIDDGKVAKFVFQPQGDSRDLTYVEALKADGVAVDAANQGVIGCLVFPEKARETKTSGGILRSRGIADGMNSRRINVNNTIYSKGGPPLQTLGMNNASFAASESPVTMDWMPTSDTSSSSVGTGFGDDKDFRTTTVKFERRDPSNPDASFVVQYDTLQGLRRRGVRVDEVKSPLQNAFPASPELARDGCHIPRNRR